MSYINVGVTQNHGRPVKTKTELKRLLKEDPDALEFYGTSMFEPGAWTVEQMNNIRGPVLPTFIVVGPDPYTKRTWYANITLTPKGPRVV